MKHHELKSYRDKQAQYLRNIRAMINQPEPVPPKLYKGLLSAACIMGYVSLLILAMSFKGCNDLAHADPLVIVYGRHEMIEGYPLSAWTNAIRRAEGSWTYGIKQTSKIQCHTEMACEDICVRTIRNNAKRFRLYGFREYPRFIEFLGSRYAPTSGRGLKESERRLNPNWIKNVSYWLNKQP